MRIFGVSGEVLYDCPIGFDALSHGVVREAKVLSLRKSRRLILDDISPSYQSYNHNDHTDNVNENVYISQDC